MPKRYRTIPMEIVAVQAINENMEEIKEFVGDNFDPIGDGVHPQIRRRADSAWGPVYYGDWVVQSVYGFMAIPCRDIPNYFEEVEDQ